MSGKRLLFLLALLSAGATAHVHAQDFKKQQAAQQSAIERAYKKKKVTEKEYYKLLAEQEAIINAIGKAEADGYMDAKEKNVIYAKLQKAGKRLRKYATNREVF